MDTCNSKNKATIVTLIVFGFLIAAAVAAIPYARREDNTALVRAVAHLMVVSPEQPIIATINQGGRGMQDQAFYKDSQPGDKLLIFPGAQRAIIYSPSRQLIVNAGPFLINQGAVLDASDGLPGQFVPQQ